MRHVGEWVVVKIEENESLHGIISTDENTGKVVSSADKTLIGKKVFYSIGGAKKNQGYVFVPYSDIYGVVD
tara:strand:- start:246 stop:458 length:213 start_codon:yes stop_codon:yes gene_type:complete